MTALSALPGTPRRAISWRHDLVLERGLLHMEHHDVTPADARLDDLLAIAEALEAGGIPLLLIRRDRSTPALVVDIDQREEIFRTLREHLPADPFYVKTKGTAVVPLEDAALAGGAPRAVRIFRPRITPTRALPHDGRHAPRVEFWRFGTEFVEAPDDNLLMRRVTPAADVTFDEVEKYGRRWRTIEGMFDPHPEEFLEPVDIVFSWVDGSSAQFQREQAARLRTHVVGEGDDSAARYRHVDELRYALRSVHMYAPWIRHIFIATDSPVPSWLGQHPRVTVVRGEEFFADPSVLPTYNSHAVESQLHRIPGLSEHFLYSNDDMFFGRSVDPEMFFSPAGHTRFVESEVRIGVGAPEAHRSGHDNGLRVNRALLREHFGRTILRDLAHCATPLRRSILFELEETFPEEFARTAAATFRSMTDISVTNSLYHYYAMLTGRAAPTTEPRVRYVHTTTAGALQRIDRLAARGDVDMLCFNDGSETDVPEHLRARALHDALERMFPVPGPWEKSETLPQTVEAVEAVAS
ncbi:stealth conserved region 3 domain-containing protein [Microbacterium sp. MAHUQ-60]|uniref:stealth conserved region 3 domain-containing protein n=1 Tax=unclassified Microbacterium TaxID=2609290 RepID=UPI00360C75DA